MSSTSTSTDGTAQGYPGGVQHVQAPTPSTNTSQNLTRVSGGSSGAGTHSPDIEFVSRTSNYVSKQANEGWDVFAFHNSATDLLRSGKLGAMSGVLSGNQLLASLPSEWKNTFGTDEAGLQQMFRSVQELASIANQVWGATTSNLASQWFPGGTWQNIQPLDQQRIQSSKDSNQGTYKAGFADHADYPGPMGQTSPSISDKGQAFSDALTQSFELGATTASLGGTELGAAAIAAIPGVDVAALAIGAVAIGGYAAYKMSGGNNAIQAFDDVYSPVLGGSDSDVQAQSSESIANTFASACSVM